MEMMGPILLVLLAWGLFVLEPIVPSFGLLSLFGLGCAVAGVVGGFQAGDGFGWALLVVAVCGAPLAYLAGLKLLPYSPIVLRDGAPPLHRTASDAAAGRAALAPGTRGRAVTALRPMGTVAFGADHCEARSAAGVLQPGCAVVVVRTEGGTPVVEPAGEV